MIIDSLALWGAEMPRAEAFRLIMAAYDLREVAEMVLETADDTTPQKLIQAAEKALARVGGGS